MFVSDCTIARTFLHLFKKLTFITGHEHYFCMNYLVDTNALKITHTNLYSAIETVTLLPVYNSTLVKEFMEENIFDYNQFATKNNLIIGLFPISDKNIYDDLVDLENSEFTESDSITTFIKGIENLDEIFVKLKKINFHKLNVLIKNKRFQKYGSKQITITGCNSFLNISLWAGFN